jgi:uncharacterized protein (TIGR00730 family)
MAAIGVFCGSSRTLDARWLDLARHVGREIGARGHTLVSGGGRVGLMGAVAEGARAAGAHTLGVMPQLLVDLEIADTESDEMIVTDGMMARKTIMIEKADAFLVLPGGLGTLDELFEVWTMAMLGLHDKPTVLLDADGFYDGLVEWLCGLVPERFVRPEAMSLLLVAPDVRAAFDLLEDAWTR